MPSPVGAISRSRLSGLRIRCDLCIAIAIKIFPYALTLRVRYGIIGNDKNEPLTRLGDALAGASTELLKHQDSELSELFFKQSRTVYLFRFKQKATPMRGGSLFSQPTGRQLNLHNSFRLIFYFWSLLKVYTFCA